MPSIEELVQQWVDDYMIGLGFLPGPPPPETVIPDALPQVLDIAVEPTLQGGRLREFLSTMALGLNALDWVSEIDPVTAPTTPVAAPVEVIVVGFFNSIGLAWQLARPVEHVVGYEIDRSTNGVDFTTLGRFEAYSWLDKNFGGDPYPASTTRYYRVRAVAEVGGSTFFGPYSAIVNATTLPGGSTNADLQARIDSFIRQIQSRHIIPEAIEETDIDSALVGGFRSLAFFMGGNDRPEKKRPMEEAKAFAFFTGDSREPVSTAVGSATTMIQMAQALAFFVGGNDRPHRKQDAIEGRAFSFFTGDSGHPLDEALPVGPPGAAELRNQAFAFFIR